MKDGVWYNFKRDYLFTIKRLEYPRYLFFDAHEPKGTYLSMWFLEEIYEDCVYIGEE